MGVALRLTATAIAFTAGISIMLLTDQHHLPRAVLGRLDNWWHSIVGYLWQVTGDVTRRTNKYTDCLLAFRG
jgi:hypothetical protein